MFASEMDCTIPKHETIMKESTSHNQQPKCQQSVWTIVD